MNASGLPSPAPSPPETVQENMSRKRNRSTSDSSADSPSSPKRAASEVPSASSDIEISHSFQRASSLVQLTNNLDIDQYLVMQDQGSAKSQTLAPHEKFSIVRTLKQREMSEGETWFVLSHSWYRRWEQACSGRVEKTGVQVDESSIPPVDNSDIADAEGNIIVSPAEGLNVEYVPAQAWEHLVQWYGNPIRPLPRTVIIQGILQETRLELFPLRLVMRVLAPNPPTYRPKPRVVTLSKTDTVEKLVSALNRISGSVQDPQKSRYWLIQGSSADNNHASAHFYTPARLTQERAKLLEVSNSHKTLEEALIENGDVFVLEKQINDEWQINETPQASRAVTPLFGSRSGQDFFARLGSSSSSTQPSSDYLTPMSSGAGITRPFSPSKPPGLVGLVNLGNTCFMASALQCLKADPELAEYFLSGAFREELNVDNPLGMHGAIAEVFGALLNRLWAPNLSSSTFSPREFKQTIARFAPSFSGYQEQDSQEFLAFLLDGLHEDLNRILKKPYVEKPEWEGGGSLEMMELAQKSWDGYMMRNDSVIVDLFQGQYKSTLICPECSKVSITFDPFMYLTLPLPITKKWQHTVYYVPWDLEQPHVQIPVELPPGSSFKQLKQLLARWKDCPSENLLTLEVWSGRFYKNLSDDISVQEIVQRDTVVCFELPCNAQQSIDFKRSEDDPLILPVFHSTQKALGSRPTYGSYGSQNSNIFGNPFVIIMTPRQATTKESITEAVVDRLSRWTVHDLYTWEGAPPDDHVVPLNKSVDTLTEIRESGEVVTVEESDITEMLTEGGTEMETEVKASPKRLGPKSDIFALRLHGPVSRYSVTESCDKAEPLDHAITWKTRIQDVKNQHQSNSEASVSLLKSGDWLVCEWDIHMQAYYFGSEHKNFENSRWRQFPEFLHPEYTASVQAREEQKKRVMNLEDCLDEFTKEEQLGEDDPWYCPRCKKHQRATKKFEIWKVPEVLVVHLKRFSSSRILRDKIDLMVDFPLEGLDLGHRVGERQLALSMRSEGMTAPDLANLDDPLLYDLFAVTEHRGGLGGGHYRAYAKNHIDSNWYLFNDTHVSKTDSQAAVNPDAYLLFYRRRGANNLKNKTSDKIRLAREKLAESSQSPEDSQQDDAQNLSIQLPTPPQDRSPPACPPREPRPLPSCNDALPAMVDAGLSAAEFDGAFESSALPELLGPEALPSPFTIPFAQDEMLAMPTSPVSSNDAYAGSSSGRSGSLSPFSASHSPAHPTDIASFTTDDFSSFGGRAPGSRGNLDFP